MIAAPPNARLSPNATIRARLERLLRDDPELAPAILIHLEQAREELAEGRAPQPAGPLCPNADVATRTSSRPS